MIKKLATLTIGLVLTVCAVGLTLDRQWQVTRHATISATPDRIYPYFSELKRWQEWSVWTREMDPQVRHTYEGQPDGVGAKWRWLGPGLGRGQLEIVSASPPLTLQLDQAIESDAVNAHASIQLSPSDQGTEVTWADEGTLPLPFGGFFRGMVEERLGNDMAKSLAKLKNAIEAKAAP